MQARLPWPVGIYTQRGMGRGPWQYYAWRLPEHAEEQVHVHAKMFAICQRDVIPLQLTRQQDEELRELCRHPALRVPPETLKFLMSAIVGTQPHRSNTKKQDCIQKLVTDAEATAALADCIAAGYDVTDMRYLNASRDDPAFGPYIRTLVDMLEERSQLAAHDRRHHEGEGNGPTLRPTPLAASLPALMRQVEDRLRSHAEYAGQLDNGTIKIPSEYAMAARLQPTHPSRLSADWRVGKLPIKWAIQRRTMRKVCPDAHYVNALGANAREFVLELHKQGVNVLFVSDDDKCKVSIGQPELPQTAATRARRVLVGELHHSFTLRVCCQHACHTSTCELSALLPNAACQRLPVKHAANSAAMQRRTAARAAVTHYSELNLQEPMRPLQRWIMTSAVLVQLLL